MNSYVFRELEAVASQLEYLSRCDELDIHERRRCETAAIGIRDILSATIIDAPATMRCPTCGRPVPTATATDNARGAR